MAAPVIAPRKPPPRKAPSRKPTSTARADRNAQALAKARSVQRARPATRPTSPPRSVPVRRKSGAAAPRAAAPAPSAVARVLNSRGMPLVDRILRGPGWVVMLGLLLAGIVFLNVSVLELNRGIAQTDANAARLERVNSGLRARVAKLDNGERIQQQATARGFVMPQPGDVTYVHERATDGKLASQRITPPAPSTQTQTSATTTTTTPTATTPTATTPTPTTATTPTPAVVPTATPTGTALTTSQTSASAPATTTVP